MGTAKDIIDIAKDLETRMKDKRDIDLLKQIHSLAFSLQSSLVEVMERDINLMEENAKLKKQLSESQSETVRIEDGIEFIKGERTSNEWKPFCPKCHMPAIFTDHNFPLDCSAECGWTSSVYEPDFDSIKNKLNA